MYYFIDGKSHSEIGEIIGVSRRTVGNRLDDIIVEMRRLGGELK